MSKVFILDTNKQPLDPIHPGWARKLLSSGRAVVYKMFPFTIILKKSAELPVVEPLRLKIDPGSKTTGIAIVNDTAGEVVFAAELAHRGHIIKTALDKRRAIRRSRRHRKTRYRQPRFANRRRRNGWLPPSIESRLSNIITWVHRLRRLCLIETMSQELVKLDTQAMENPEISGIEYQQGTLMGYEIREYLLEKWERSCVYCGKQDIPLQVEHIIPRAKGGTNQVINLTLAYESCNIAKGTQDIHKYLKHQPDLLSRILVHAKSPLKDAAAVNITRWLLYDRLQEMGLPVEVGTGGCTKWNRVIRNLPKTHWMDACCVGASTPEFLKMSGTVPLLITANGRGSRQLCRMDKYGFPRTGPKKVKIVKGFQTGDIVRAVVTKGKKVGTYIGRASVRSTGRFDIKTKQGTVQGISRHNCTLLHHCDGYSYCIGQACFLS